MIEFNRILQPRLVMPLVRLFGMKVGQSPAPTLAPEVAPGFEVNQQDDPTLRFLRQERFQSYVANLPAVVGQIGTLRVRNPSNSGVLIVIKRIIVISTSTLTHGPGVQTADLTTVETSLPGDIRWIASGGSRGTAVVSRETAVAPTAPAYAIIPSSNSDPFDQEIVVPPGAAWSGILGTANVTATINVQWVERPVAAEELATG